VKNDPLVMGLEIFEIEYLEKGVILGVQSKVTRKITIFFENQLFEFKPPCTDRRFQKVAPKT